MFCKIEAKARRKKNAICVGNAIKIRGSEEDIFYIYSSSVSVSVSVSLSVSSSSSVPLSSSLSSLLLSLGDDAFFVALPRRVAICPAIVSAIDVLA